MFLVQVSAYRKWKPKLIFVQLAEIFKLLKLFVTLFFLYQLLFTPFEIRKTGIPSELQGRESHANPCFAMFGKIVNELAHCCNEVVEGRKRPFGTYSGHTEGFPERHFQTSE